MSNKDAPRPARFPLGLDDLGPRPVARAAARGVQRPVAALAEAAPVRPAGHAAAREPVPAVKPAGGGSGVHGPLKSVAARPAGPTHAAAVGKAATGAALRGMLRPQRLLHEAAQDAARLRPSLGLGLDSAGVRQRMVARLRADGITHAGLLDAMGRVPRHEFVDSALVSQAYEDTSLPIGHQQTISKPSVVARMIELLLQGEAAQSTGHLGPTLEIGTGCGYQAAVLAELSPQLVSIERVRPLYEKATRHLRATRLNRVRLIFGDGMLGHPPRAPFQSIIAAAGGEDLPAPWLDQLAVGGRLVAPLQRGRGQLLVVVDRTSQGLRRTEHEAVLFVPLKSGVV